MALTLGNKPEGLRVLLNRGADLMFSIRSLSGAWATGVRLELQVGTQVWVAEIAGDLATWAVDQADVDAAIDSPDQTARLWYIDPAPTQVEEVRLLLAQGTAVANA